MKDGQFEKTEKKQVGVMILIFMSIVPSLLFSYWGISNVNIYINKNEYKQGVFIVEKIKCPSSSRDEGTYCYASGKINNLYTEIGLGLYPGEGSIYGEEAYANLGKKEYEVFYRPNGNQTLIKRENETKFNAMHYLKKGILELILPLIVLPLFIFYYKHLTRKLKNIKHEEK
jgi:hypothetical protein